MEIEKTNEDSVKEYGKVRTDTGIEAITIIGQIEGHFSISDQSKTTKYEHIIPLLVDMEQCKEVKGVIFLLNTVGGDVEAGLAIAEMIATMSKPTVSVVLGGGHSIGVPIAVAAMPAIFKASSF